MTGKKFHIGIQSSVPSVTIDASSVSVIGTFSVRDRTTAQTLEVSNTYTSATSLETFRVKAVAAAAYQIGSAVGSAGGTNRAITFGHWNTAGTFVGTAGITTAATTYGGRFSDTGGSAEGAEQFGDNSLTSYQSLAVGGYAHASAQFGTAIGRCSYAGYFCTSLGRNAGTSGTSGGYPSAHAYSYDIVISDGTEDVAPTASSQFIVAGLWTEAYFGKKVTHATPLDVRFNATGGSGANIAGASFTLAGGKGTGTGAGGSLIFQTAPAGSSGSSANSLVTRLTIDSTGASTFAGDLLFTDATYDIGKSGATRPRHAYLSGNLAANGSVSSNGGANSYLFAADSSYAIGYVSGNMTFTCNNDYALVLTPSLKNFRIPSDWGYSWSSSTPNNTGPDLYLYRDAAGILHQRNSTNAQTFRLAETYTSSTSFGTFQIKANAGAAYQIGSAIGSAGGTNRAIDFGHWNAAGTFASALNIATTGAATFSSTINTMDFATGNYNLGVGYSTNVSLGFASTALGWTARATHNYAISIGASAASAAANQFTVGDSTNVSKFRFGTGVAAVTFDNPLILGQLVSTSGSPTAFTITGAAHTTLALSTEATDVNFNLARTVQFATGALTTQRAVRIQAPTYSFVGASTITTASTLSISGPPAAGTNATITNAFALNVESGKIRAVGGLVVGTTDGFTSSLDIGNGLVQAWASGYSCLVMNFGGNPLSYHANWGLGGIQLQDRSAGFGWSSLSNNLTNFDAAFYSPAANIIEQRRTTYAQTFRVYGTYTSATSYELFNIKGKASANFEIGPENGSAGGTLRGLTLGCYPAGTSTIVGWAQFRPNTSTGALEAFYLGPIADSTAVGGNARGTDAVDLQISRTSASQVASGAGAFLAGRRGTASGAGSFCYGDDSAATAQFAVALGCFANATGYATLAIGVNAAASGSQSICISNGNAGSSATAQDAIAIGHGALADRIGIVATANGKFAVNGDSQKIDIVLRNRTTDATPVTLFSNGSSTRLTIPSGKILFADIIISGIKSDGSAAACYKRKVAIKNVAGTTSLVGSVETIGTDHEDNASTDVAITADNTNDALDISVTGIAAETWRWTATFSGLEIAYGT